jgi:hypothetical protein
VELKLTVPASDHHVVVPDQLSKRLRKARGFGVEVDAMPGGYVCSASMKSTARADVRETL